VTNRRLIAGLCAVALWSVPNDVTADPIGCSAPKGPTRTQALLVTTTPGSACLDSGGYPGPGLGKNIGPQAGGTFADPATGAGGTWFLIEKSEVSAAYFDVPGANTFLVDETGLAYAEYALGPGGSAPKWAVFVSSGNALSLQAAIAPAQAIPEPASLLLLGVGLGAVAWRIGRRKGTVGA
jgi:hypothetical protein